MEGANRGATPHEEEAARLLAAQWELQFREAHTLALDPSALGIIDPLEARRLEALPLRFEGGRPIFAVAEPSEERFGAVRQAAGADANFVVVTHTTLHALMNSKVFSLGRRSAAPLPPPLVTPAAEPTPPAAALGEAAVDAASSPDPQAPPTDETDERDADASSVEPVSEPAAYQPPPPLPPLMPRVPAPSFPLEAQAVAAPARPTLVAVGPESPDSTSARLLEGLLAQISATAASMSAQIGELDAALEDNRRELSETRAELDGVREENDRSRAAIDHLQAELARSRSINDATTHHLRELLQALEASGSGAVGAGDVGVAYEAATRIA